jgi:hypothetical protein
MQENENVAPFKVLARHLPGGTEENQEESQMIWRPRFEHGTSRIWKRIKNSTATFDRNFEGYESNNITMCNTCGVIL